MKKTENFFKVLKKEIIIEIIKNTFMITLTSLITKLSYNNFIDRNNFIAIIYLIVAFLIISFISYTIIKFIKEIKIKIIDIDLKNQISNFIINNKENYRKQKTSRIEREGEEKLWMYNNLKNKYPDLEISKLENYINIAYNELN